MIILTLLGYILLGLFAIALAPVIFALVFLIGVIVGPIWLVVFLISKIFS